MFYVLKAKVSVFLFYSIETEEQLEAQLQKRSIKLCSRISNPDFAITTCSNKNFLDSECEFKCRPGFTLSGVSVISCRLTSDEPQWSDAPPICIPAASKSKDLCLLVLILSTFYPTNCSKFDRAVMAVLTSVTLRSY